MGLYLTPWLRRQQARYHYRQALTQMRKGNVEVALTVLPQALVIMLGGYWGYQRIHGSPEASAAPVELTKPPIPAEADK